MRSTHKVIAAVATGGLVVALGVVATNLATAAQDEQLPHEPGALQVAMRGEVGDRFDFLGPATFVPLTPNLQVIGRVRSTHTASLADSAYLLYGSDDHTMKVFVGPANSELRSQSATDLCAGGVSRYALSCSAENSDAGGLLLTTVYAFSATDEPNAPRQLVDDAALSSVSIQDLEFERNVRFLATDGSMTSVTETLRSPSSKNANEQFAVSVADLASVATDTGLSWQ